MTNNLRKYYSIAVARLAACLCAAWVAGCSAGVAQTVSSVEPNPASNAPAILTKGSAQINAVTRNNSKSASTLVLAQDGKALLPIVISDKASEATKATATEFADYLKRITGAEFKIETGDGSTGIVVGTIKDFPNPALDKSLEIFNGFDGVESFVIRTREKKLMLIGARDLGASHAVWRFLEEIGYRHYFSHSAWEIIPHKSTLVFDRDITDRPAMLAREITMAGLLSGEVQHWKDYFTWKRHNLMAESFVPSIGHNVQAIIDANKEAFAAHPEYYALTKLPDGTLKRSEPMIEFGNPTVRKMVVDYVVKYFDDNPNADMVSIEPADTLEGSFSPEAKALGSNSDQIFGMANEAAKALQKAHPGKMVGVLSYNTHWDPPTFPMEPNVHVELSGLGQGFDVLTPEKRDELWQQRSKNLGFYDYYSVWAWNTDELPGPWINDIHELQLGIRKQITMGGTSLHAESSNSWGLNGRAFYLASKLLWNPDIDVDAVEQDFYNKAFGAGASAMKRYYDRYDPSQKQLMSGHLLGLMFRDMDEASKKTQDDPEVQARLDQLKLYLRYERLAWERNTQAQTDEERAKLKTQILTSLYRARAYEMDTWQFFQFYWGDNKMAGPDKADWMVDEPYTHQEIEQEFQDSVKYFGARIREVMPFVPFSENLVPVNWPGEHPPILSKQNYSGSLKYYLYSRKGEPLEFTIYAGTGYTYVDDFNVLDAKGKVIYHRENIPRDSTTHHKVPVPAPGLYVLDYNDPGSQWSMETAAGVACTIPLLDKGGVPSTVFRAVWPMQDMYFYVPKGIKTFEYFYTKTVSHPAGPHNVLNPNGETVQPLVGGKPIETKDFMGNYIVDVNGDYVTVPVPEGMDGKLWRFHVPILGFFRFSNIPNYFAASPDALLVPREVAEKDGLQIIK